MFYQLGQFLVFKNVAVPQSGPARTCLLSGMHGEGILTDFFLQRRAYSAFVLMLTKKLLGLGDGLF